MQNPGRGQAPEQSRRHQRPAVVGAARARRRFRPGALLAALGCGALVAATVAALPQEDPLAAPAAWSDQTTLSWTPVADATSYVVVSNIGGRITQHVVSCCSWTMDGLEATASHFVRANRPGSRWTRAGHGHPRAGVPTGTVTSAPVATTAPRPTTSAPTTSKTTTTTTTTKTTTTKATSTKATATRTTAASASTRPTTTARATSAPSTSAAAGAGGPAPTTTRTTAPATSATVVASSTSVAATTTRAAATTTPARSTTTVPVVPVVSTSTPATTTTNATTLPPTTTAAATTTTTTPVGPPVTAPPVATSAGKVCDNIAATYPAAPAGAIVVDPAVAGDLVAKTDAAPAGSTFWLKPGVHTLGSGQYDQVVPKNGDTFLGAPGAVIDGKGRNDFAFTQQATNVTISNLTVQGFTAPQDQGVVNHDSADGWTIRNSTIQDNRGAGLMAGARQKVLGNCLRDNGQYAMNAYQEGDKITGMVVQGNEIVGNNTDDWENKQPGCGCSGGIKFWAVNGADVRANWVHDNHGVGLWADTNNNDFLIEDNLIEDNDGEGVFYEISYNLILRDNVLRKNALVSGKEFADRGDDFPEASVYLSESGGDPRIPARTSKIDISGNTFDNNWSGITVWENADRFCNSPANSSSGDCTRLVPKVSTCSTPAIDASPLLDTCRWKSQNIEVHANTFAFDPKVVGCTNGMCGRMALLSNYGTFPSWSPYKGDVVQNAITFQQANSWRGNTYSGPWKFVPLDTSHSLTPAQWTAAPYGQDACSSFTGGAPSC
jgi:hypothetical protein